MVCKRCNGLGILMRVTDTLHGKDFEPDMCECEMEHQYQKQLESRRSIVEKDMEDRKVLIHDVREAAPELRDCSKGVRESPE